MLFGDKEDDDVSTADLRKELFEAEDIIVGRKKDNDHGLGELLERQKERAEKTTTQEKLESISETTKK